MLVILILISERKATNGPAFAIGWGLAVFAAVSLFALLGGAADADSDETVSNGVNWLQVALGALFVWFGIRSWQKRPRPGVVAPEPKLFGAVGSMSALLAFGVGALLAVANAKNLPLEISAGGSIAQAGLSSGDAVVVIALFALVASLSVLVPVVAVLVLGERTREPLDATKEWLLANNATIMLVLFSILGAKMLGKGLALSS